MDEEFARQDAVLAHTNTSPVSAEDSFCSMQEASLRKGIFTTGCAVRRFSKLDSHHPGAGVQMQVELLQQHPDGDDFIINGRKSHIWCTYG